LSKKFKSIEKETDLGGIGWGNGPLNSKKKKKNYLGCKLFFFFNSDCPQGPVGGGSVAIGSDSFATSNRLLGVAEATPSAQLGWPATPLRWLATLVFIFFF
jgi:hypothetical protein